MRIFFLLTITVIYCEGWEITPPDSVLVQTNHFVDYIYYPQKIPWIAARRVCQSLGGDFAKIDSAEQLEDIRRMAEENYGDDIFIEEYWVGLVELVEGNYFWVSDCSNLTFTSKYMDTFVDTKLCFRLKRDHTSERRSCQSKEGFMCQILSAKPCAFSTRLNGEILSVGSDLSSCLTRCSDDVRCWGTVEYIPDNCVTLALPGYGVHSLNLTSKFCQNVTLNTTTVVPDETADNVIPNATCGSLVITPTSSNSSLSVVTSIDLPPCEPVSITQNVTVVTTQHNYLTTTEHLTMTSNVTLMTTEYSTVTSTESLTTTTVSTSTTTMTTVSTEYVNINSTYTVTSTVRFTSRQNITTEQADEIAQEIVKNLTIDTKSTSSHIRRLTSVRDNRQSAMFVGYVGVIFVVVPLGLMLIADVKKLFLDFHSHEHIYRKK